MKQYSENLFFLLYPVVPLVGTWIETTAQTDYFGMDGSFPSWERGLKLGNIPHAEQVTDVVPLVGTWIETEDVSDRLKRTQRRSPRGNVD